MNILRIAFLFFLLIPSVLAQEAERDVIVPNEEEVQDAGGTEDATDSTSGEAAQEEEIIDDLMCKDLLGSERSLCLHELRLLKAGEGIPSCHPGERHSTRQQAFCQTKKRHEQRTSKRDLSGDRFHQRAASRAVMTERQIRARNFFREAREAAAIKRRTEREPLIGTQTNHRRQMQLRGQHLLRERTNRRWRRSEAPAERDLQMEERSYEPNQGELHLGRSERRWRETSHLREKAEELRRQRYQLEVATPVQRQRRRIKSSTTYRRQRVRDGSWSPYVE